MFLRVVCIFIWLDQGSGGGASRSDDYKTKLSCFKKTIPEVSLGNRFEMDCGHAFRENSALRVS